MKHLVVALLLVLPVRCLSAADAPAQMPPASRQAATTTAPTTTTAATVATAATSPASGPATRLATNAPASRRPATKPTIAFPTWGVALSPPAGWGRAAERDLTVVGQWMPRDGSRGMLLVLCSPLLRRSPRGMAQQTADTVGGSVQEATLDGRAARMVNDGRSGEAACFAERNGYLYELRYQRVPPNPAEFEAIRSSWQWSEVDSPLKHPELRPDLIPVMDQFALQLPEHMRPWAVPAPPGTANFAAIDISGQRIRREFHMELAMPSGIQGKPLNELATRMSEPVQTQLKLKQPIAWRILKGKDDRIMSQTLLAPIPPDQPNIKPRFGTCMALVALDNQRRVYVNFIANTENADDRYAYMVMAEQIMTSIVPLDVGGRQPR
jgi:hypothetical protein